MSGPSPSPVVEDYVKVIYAHTEWQPEPINSKKLALRLGVAPSSVSEMLRKLIHLGLATHRTWGRIELTGQGRSLALRMVRRHRLIETYLVSELDYTWDEVHDEAERLEHVLSERMIERIDRKLGRPVRDPHGDPIPTAEGAVEVPAAVRLDLVEPGVETVVVRIDDADPAALKELEAAGVALDRKVDASFRDRLETLPLDVRQRVWVSAA